MNSKTIKKKIRQLILFWLKFSYKLLANYLNYSFLLFSRFKFNHHKFFRQPLASMFIPIEEQQGILAGIGKL